jgi:cytochrome oxidase Cu insertion factor (SCO1/SenC/PrrC family)
VPSSSGGRQDADLDWPIADFRLTDQDGHAVTRDDLRGKVWVASFIFTRCRTICPRITSKVAQLRDELAKEKGVRFVSFSVDPEHDTPEVLKRYAKTYHADAERWHFLTGPEKEVYALLRGSFRDLAEQNRGTARTPGNEVMHSPRIFVVDRAGRVRGYCDGTEGDCVPRLRRKVLQLVREKP